MRRTDPPDGSTSERCRAYACVYRAIKPKDPHRRRTEQRATQSPLLERFLAAYDDGYYDWGDDPSFFAATDLLGSPDHATWGVCRRDIRASLRADDFIVFFCAKQRVGRRWEYYYVGVATIGELLLPRSLAWDGRPYGQFLNLLVRADGGSIVHREWFHPEHPEWRRRVNAPYVVFDPAKTRINVERPPHVAMFDGPCGGIETWRNDATARRVADLVLPTSGQRGLRSRNPYIAHPPLNLAEPAKRARSFNALRSELITLANV
jgi:hypothetical protein